MCAEIDEMRSDSPSPYLYGIVCSMIIKKSALSAAVNNIQWEKEFNTCNHCSYYYYYALVVSCSLHGINVEPILTQSRRLALCPIVIAIPLRCRDGYSGVRWSNRVSCQPFAVCIVSNQAHRSCITYSIAFVAPPRVYDFDTWTWPSSDRYNSQEAGLASSVNCAVHRFRMVKWLALVHTKRICIIVFIKSNRKRRNALYALMTWTEKYRPQWCAQLTIDNTKSNRFDISTNLRSIGMDEHEHTRHTTTPLQQSR